MSFRYYGLRKSSLDICLKSPTSDDPLTRHIVDRPNIVALWTTVPLPYLVIIWTVSELGKVSFSDTKDLITVC